MILDTDHLWGIGGGRDWVWKSYLAGHHPIYMDPLDADPLREDARRAMGHTRRLAERLDLANLAPSPSGHCLAGEKEMVMGEFRRVRDEIRSRIAAYLTGEGA